MQVVVWHRPGTSHLVGLLPTVLRLVVTLARPCQPTPFWSREPPRQSHIWYVPFVAHIGLFHNLLTSFNPPVALTVGSPTLATFSLTLTAINTRWANNRFSGIEYPNHKRAL